ncbi:hypothetical protein AVEN_7091-1 [Araneus ventricosus]|uniref:DUF5641 domain-containing protein n=1 Tax=Araneus ventricosus TaxID=182803 RepID=A0A4Y2UFK0_ARAVE|nr:hypothetical protein AVEN_7091-1 [Araneus ventricosus]
MVTQVVCQPNYIPPGGQTLGGVTRRPRETPVAPQTSLRHLRCAQQTICLTSGPDIVLLWNENLKRIHWPLGRILSIYASKDGIVRRARIKTKSGIVIRRIRKLCPLELDGESLITNEDEVPDTPGDPERQEVPESNTVTTRAGRQARPPSRYIP